MSYEDAFNAAVSRQGPAAPRTDVPVPTSANLLQPLPPYSIVLAAIHSIKDTDSYTKAVATMKAEGLDDADIAGYINAYSPGGMWYGK